MLSAVAVLNEVLDTKDPQAVIEQLTDSPLGFTNMDQDNLNRYDDYIKRWHLQYIERKAKNTSCLAKCVSWARWSVKFKLPF